MPGGRFIASTTASKNASTGAAFEMQETRTTTTGASSRPLTPGRSCIASASGPSHLGCICLVRTLRKPLWCSGGQYDGVVGFGRDRTHHQVFAAQLPDAGEVIGARLARLVRNSPFRRPGFLSELFSSTTRCASDLRSGCWDLYARPTSISFTTSSFRSLRRTWPDFCLLEYLPKIDAGGRFLRCGA